jgi:hypothetical protein
MSRRQDVASDRPANSCNMRVNLHARRFVKRRQENITRRPGRWTRMKITLSQAYDIPVFDQPVDGGGDNQLNG